jgi:hypothetical protein
VQVRLVALLAIAYALPIFVANLSL